MLLGLVWRLKKFFVLCPLFGVQAQQPLQEATAAVQRFEKSLPMQIADRFSDFQKSEPIVSGSLSHLNQQYDAIIAGNNAWKTLRDQAIKQRRHELEAEYTAQSKQQRSLQRDLLKQHKQRRLTGTERGMLRFFTNEQVEIISSGGEVVHEKQRKLTDLESFVRFLIFLLAAAVVGGGALIVVHAIAGDWIDSGWGTVANVVCIGAGLVAGLLAGVFFDDMASSYTLTYTNQTTQWKQHLYARERQKQLRQFEQQYGNQQILEEKLAKLNKSIKAKRRKAKSDAEQAYTPDGTTPWYPVRLDVAKAKKLVRWQQELNIDDLQHARLPHDLQGTIVEFGSENPLGKDLRELFELWNQAMRKQYPVLYALR